MSTSKNSEKLKWNREEVNKKLGWLGVKIDWDKLSGTAYENNPKLLLDEYLLVKNALGDVSGNAVLSPDDFLGSVYSGDTGELTDDEMRGLGML
jgi:hypothetical protein